MRKFLTALLAALVCCLALAAAACDDGNKKEAVLLKQGEAITLQEGDSRTVNLSEYIDAEGTEYSYSVSSGNPAVATASVNGSTMTVAAVSEGETAITASAGEVSATFSVTVNKATAAQPKPAPEFSEKEISYDLKDSRSAEITLAPDRGEATYQYTYVLKDEDGNVTIEGDKLTVSYATVIEKTLTVVATYTDSADPSAEAKAVEFSVKLTVSDSTPAILRTPSLKASAVQVSKDIYAETDKTGLNIDFAENIDNPDGIQLAYTVTKDETPVTLTGSTYGFVYGTYSETEIEEVFNVKISFTIDEESDELEYTYTLKLKDTTSYRAVNGGFADGLTGWTASDAENPVGAVSETATFWGTDEFEGYPIFNVGKYFAGDESKTGTLKSSLFTVGGLNKITFMLGAAGNPDCYITLENEDGTVLAIWRNTKFADEGNWDVNEIGKTQFANNLVTYVADLTEYRGQQVRVVLNDNATSNFGFINFDELVTYYASAEDLPEGAVATVNELADKTELSAAIDGALTVQGDYTDESFAAYTSKVEEARSLLNKLSATQAQVDAAKAAIETAYSELVIRIPAEKADAEKSFRLLVNGNKELTIADYIYDNNLDSLTYEVSSADESVTVGDIEDGRFTVTAGADEVENVSVTIAVKYKGNTVLTVVLTVTVTSEEAPVLKKTEVVTDIDLYSAENKTDITIDFAGNVENAGGLELSYAVTLNGEPLTLNGTSYTYAYASYTETETSVVFAVTVSFSQNGEDKVLSYNYTLNIKDTRSYRITNGGFDDGLEGWTLSNSDLGGVNDTQTYWGNVPFNNDGNFFNAYATAKESAMGTLTSSMFVIGGSGWITYKLGAAKNADKVYLDVIEKDTGLILERYYNNAFSDDQSQTEVRGCTLLSYRADLSAHMGKTVYIRLSDNAESDYGLFFVDSFVTYYAEEPEAANTATSVAHPDTIYQLYNGGFETGDLTGWTLKGDIGVVTGDNVYWNDSSRDYNKDGDYLFSWWTWNSEAEAEVNREGNIGTLESNRFILRKNALISFKFGGGCNNNEIYIEIVKSDGTVLAKFYNTNPSDGRLISYYYQFENMSEDEECYVRVVDNATSGWGCLSLDSFDMDCSDAEGRTEAVNQIA